MSILYLTKEERICNGEKAVSSISNVEEKMNFFSISLLMRWPKYWSFSFSIRPSKEIPGLISFRMAWLNLLAVQGTLESLLQHHSSKVSILWCSAFFIVQLSHLYTTTGKTIAFTTWTFVGKPKCPSKMSR